MDVAPVPAGCSGAPRLQAIAHTTTSFGPLCAAPPEISSQHIGSPQMGTQDPTVSRSTEKKPIIYMLENVFQFFLTREDQEAMLARVRKLVM